MKNPNNKDKRNPNVPDKFSKKELKEIMKEAEGVRQKLVDQGLTYLPEYAFLNHYIDLAARGVKSCKQHLARAIEDIINHDDLQYLFFTSEDPQTEKKNEGN